MRYSSFLLYCLFCIIFFSYYLHPLCIRCYVTSPFNLVFAQGGDYTCTDWEVMTVISKIIQVVCAQGPPKVVMGW
uniref:Putative ovule protein n=1 Tax=Solanum chacoense TaxID=4108 RepID=A0A0V0H183_SOLCH